MRTTRAGVLAVALAVLALPAAATEQAVTFKSGDETVSGLLVTPEKGGPFPGVVVIHEWWGLDQWVKDQARALAREGYAALAVDLYRGKVTNKQEEAHQLMMGTPPDRAIRDLKAPVLGNFGGEDKGPSPEQVRAFEKAMEDAGKTVDVKIYEGAGHAFANVNNPWGGYREAAAKDAWSRTVAFLDRRLKK